MPQAVEFYERMLAGAPDAHERLDLVLEPKLIYLQNPKVASTAIRKLLAELSGKKNFFMLRHRKGVYGNPPRMKHVGLRRFYQHAIDPETFVFTFVRNPYDRLISAWANKFANKPLIAGSLTRKQNSVITNYLRVRADIDPQLPAGPDAMLSFPQFIRYACLTADTFIEKHLYLQAKIAEVPGITINLVGKYENFQSDLSRLYDHIKAPPTLRQRLEVRVNHSRRARCSDYFTQALADQVFAAYERDFDAFGYSRAVPD